MTRMTSFEAVSVGRGISKEDLYLLPTEGISGGKLGLVMSLEACDINTANGRYKGRA